jgi:hypothetical protein
VLHAFSSPFLWRNLQIWLLSSPLETLPNSSWDKKGKVWVSAKAMSATCSYIHWRPFLYS